MPAAVRSITVQQDGRRTAVAGRNIVSMPPSMLMFMLSCPCSFCRLEQVMHLVCSVHPALVGRLVLDARPSAVTCRPPSAIATPACQLFGAGVVSTGERGSSVAVRQHRQQCKSH